MKVLITGTSQGIGKGIAELFLSKGGSVIGIDRNSSSIKHPEYVHITCDIRDQINLPVIEEVQILINNAGVQNDGDIEVNLRS